ncbi:hypothetical protein [Desulfobacca acetoxidans]|uniref:Preprotein translocase subunit SecB n=1 Tax=Desulfobacca acetoxidans (strain ATCC 700848 / DSM 11109 / ASRB2) TaxID=880072 RepID=F2NFG6_DESAR|nr:hypothetical protein [Desulfobacca acetoxidans]AEB10085.1 hypothetical protein Desac_2261 [Desulfobacca acetoxidans DSM 11109]HAY20977.1 hypothetical protein [Desulfobacterales bacterium]
MTAKGNDKSIKEGSGLDFKVIQRVAEKASLEDIFLIDAEIKSDPVHRDGRGATLRLVFGSDIRPKGSIDKLAVLCNFLVSAVKEGDKEDFSLEIKATFSVNYKIHSPDTFSASDIEMFAKINPIYNCWPYWREFVQNITARMGLPTLTIPLFKISKPMEDSGNPEEKSSKASNRKSTSKSE